MPVESAPATGEDARCFDHPDLRAEHTCEYCGRLLCSLCAIELDGHVRCGRCCTAEDPSHGWRTVPELFQYDSLAWFLVSAPWVPLALWLVLAPSIAWLAGAYDIENTTLVGALAVGFMFGWVSLFTAPVSLWLVLRYRRQRTSLLPRTRVRWWLAGIGAVVLMMGWIAFFALTAVAV